MIEGNAFRECPQLTVMTIPRQWQLIGDRFMNKDEEFHSFELPNSIVKVNGEMVKRQRLRQFDIPTYVTSIGDCSFFFSESLQSISIPTSVSKIGEKVFSGCKSLTSISIPTSVSEIGRFAFNWCYSLTSINIPSSVTSFGRGCFYSSGITKENYPELPDHCFKG